MNYLFIFLFSFLTLGQDDLNVNELELDNPDDLQLLMEEFNNEDEGSASELSDSSRIEDTVDKTPPAVEQELFKTDNIDELPSDLNETVDDLQVLKDDLKDLEFDLDEDKKVGKEAAVPTAPETKPETNINIAQEGAELDVASDVFDIGAEEKRLLEIAQTMKGQIANSTWNEIITQASESSYTVVKDDWLWKISQRLFGSGFYYAKIWSLNSYITNPHEIEPGMVLVFNTGSSSELPEVSIGEDGQARPPLKKAQGTSQVAMTNQANLPSWLKERNDLVQDGAYIQYSTADTLEDLEKIGKQTLVDEYESYDPPTMDLKLSIPSNEYDRLGFDKSQKINKEFKEGYYLRTFVSSNIVQDFGAVTNGIEAKAMFTKFDTLYVSFNDSIDVSIGDKFSVYTSEGEVAHEGSDRSGRKYTIVGSIQVLQKHDEKWECKVISSSSVINRGDRLTVYTPKIERITTTFNNRVVEAILVAGYNRLQEYASFGDVVYIDRGRADGVEIGNVFEVYGFRDRGTNRLITKRPTYKNGELTVISITDNFATALVTQSKRDFKIGAIAITKTKKDALKAIDDKSKLTTTAKNLEEQGLEELNIELNLDDLNDDLLDKADQIKYTEDELAELEREERKKSVISESEKDLQSLEKLETELTTAEQLANEGKNDEDKLLESENLDTLEKNLDNDYAESVEEVEDDIGKLYLDEEINDKENPYGLTEYDIEEVDELLNVDSEKKSLE